MSNHLMTQFDTDLNEIRAKARSKFAETGRPIRSSL